MKEIRIKIEKNTKMVYLPKNIFIVNGENLQSKLVFEFIDEFVDGQARLEYQPLFGTKKYQVLTKKNNTYTIPLKSTLTGTSKIDLQLVITEGTNENEIPIFKSKMFFFNVDDSINAETEELDEYITWMDIANTKLNAFEEGLEELDSAITETNNLDLVLSDKVDGNVTVTLTKKDSTTKTVTLSDGISLMFHWDGTRLGIKTERDENYTYVDLQGCQGERGETGATPNIQIGTVTSGNTPSVTRIGTNENPIFNFTLEKGEKGDKGDTGDKGETGNTGNGISTILKTATDGLNDIYTITFTNGSTTTFSIKNGEDGEVTQEQLDTIVKDLNYYKTLENTLPKVQGTGYDVILEDTAEAPLKLNLKTDEMYQESSTGKNLANTQITDWNYLGVKVSYNEESQILTINGTATGNAQINFSNYFFDSIQANDSDQINLVVQYISGSCISSDNARIFMADENYTQSLQVPLNDINITKSDSKTLTSDLNFSILQFGYRAGDKYDNLKIRIMASIGDDLTYEKYTGKEPAPNCDYPMKIHTISGDNKIIIKNIDESQSQEFELNLGVENLYNKNNANILNSYINSTNKTIERGVTTKTLYVPISINTTYTISKILSSRFMVMTCINEPQNGVVGTKMIESNNSTAITITSGSNDKYLAVFYYNSDYDTLTEQEISNSIQVEKGTKANSYSPYGQNPIELCKWGEKEDGIIENNGKWYKRAEIGKLVLNGNEPSWRRAGTSRFLYDFDGMGDKFGYCNNFYYYRYTVLARTPNNTFSVNTNMTNFGFIKKEFDDLDEFKDFINENPIIIYYPLRETQYQEITDTNLINNLNNIKYALSYNKKTKIMQLNNDAKFIIEATGIKGETGVTPNIQIGDVTKNDNNINLINPSLCVDNSAPRSADGVISDNNNYWRTDYILLPANTNYLLTLQENNNIGSNFLASRCYYYDENKTYINSSSYSQPNNNTENDLYVIIGLNKELITYENRFKLMMSKGSIRKKFTPNTELNKNNINMDIKYNDLNVEILKNLNNLPNFEYEVGTISSSSGNNTPSTARIRTKNYYYINKISQIKVLNDYVKFWIYKYDDNFNSYSYEQLTNDYIINESGWYRLIFAFKNDREITNDNINELISSFNIVSSNDIVNNIINKNINYSNSLLYAGEKLDFNLINYEQQTFRNYAQDSCYYNNKLFSFNSEGIFKVYDFFTKETVNDCYLAEYATIKPHCNSACFGNEFYNSSDKFPLLYVNAYNTADLPLGTCYVHRIIESNNTYTSNLVQTIQIGFTNDEIWTISGDTRPYGNFVVDTDNNYLYVYTLRGNNTRFFKFNLPVLNNGSSIILTTNDIIEYFDIEFMPFIQGCTYYNNKIYLVNGNNSSISNSSSLNAIDLLKKEISTHINISSLNNEPEAIFFKDTLYIAGNGGYFRKLIQ